MFDKIWCSHCNKYTYQTTGGCIICGKTNINYDSGSVTVPKIEKEYLDPVEDYTDFTEPM